MRGTHILWKIRVVKPVLNTVVISTDCNIWEGSVK